MAVRTIGDTRYVGPLLKEENDARIEYATMLFGKEHIDFARSQPYAQNGNDYLWATICATLDDTAIKHLIDHFETAVGVLTAFFGTPDQWQPILDAYRNPTDTSNYDAIRALFNKVDGHPLTSYFTDFPPELTPELKTRERASRAANAAIHIQAAYRRHTAKSAFATTRTATITVQSATRGFIARRNFLKNKTAATLFQTAFRRFQAKSAFTTSRSAATSIQSATRGFIARRNFLKNKTAATLFQTAFRRFQAKSSFTTTRIAAISIQSTARGFIARRSLHNQKQQRAATRIQAALRGYIAKSSFVKTRRAAKLVARFSYKKLAYPRASKYIQELVGTPQGKIQIKHVVNLRERIIELIKASELEAARVEFEKLRNPCPKTTDFSPDTAKKIAFSVNLLLRRVEDHLALKTATTTSDTGTWYGKPLKFIWDGMLGGAIAGATATVISGPGSAAGGFAGSIGGGVYAIGKLIFSSSPTSATCECAPSRK
ncbi:MAG: hypothetical protein MRY21_02510 [Simkaniaceae bacterium]|nr:hypothetical protein [Simkaniaceae bacterium]